MANEKYEILRQAIERNAGSVLSLPSAGMIRHHKTRFLSGTEHGFWMQSIVGESPFLDDLIHREAPVGVTFRVGDGTLGFATPIQRRQADFQVNETTVMEALFLPFPDAFREYQRRTVFRVGLAFDHAVNMRVWRVAEHAILRDRPMAAQEIHVRLTNLSVMGMGVCVARGRDNRPVRGCVGERLRLSLDIKGDELVMEGRVIHLRPVRGNQMMMGLQLKKLEKDLDGRQALSKLTFLVGELQRDEIRRRRMLSEAA